MASKKIKLLILISALAIIIAILIVIFKPTSNHAETLNQSTTTSSVAATTGTPSSVEPTNAKRSFSDLLKASQQRRSQFHLDENRLATAANQQKIMQNSDAQTVAQHFPLLNEKQQKDGRRFVQYDPYIVEAKFVGDHIKIDIPNTGKSYDGKMTDVEQVDDDIVRWRGDLDGVNGQMSNFTVTQTMKDQYAIAVFHTPQGEFIMESKNGYGWVASGEAELDNDQK
ncbi:metalloprotease secretion chaperone CpaB [Aquirhabdus parva]|uniref:Metalloprotease secretion chaperone CpaB n=1 Tax=Aquirhabdus parva TaxID=2283318 RepID=A0A345P9K1_9GAMM|nr:metalloprotease secretion chaperone CpaB [Aquirhabdus parva]AXI03960.1 metalloprotease secretion chaperone CpaB [Aquirhabdus parva]